MPLIMFRDNDDRDRIAVVSTTGVDALRRVEPGPLWVSNRNDALGKTISSQTLRSLERVDLVRSFITPGGRQAAITPAGRRVLRALEDEGY